MKSYGGISEHEQKSDIDSFIIDSKVNGDGFRGISKALAERFELNVSHTLIQGYYKEQLRGESIDSLISRTKGDNKGSFAKGEPVEIDPNLLAKVKDELNDETVLGGLYAHAVALCHKNMQDHLDGKSRLKSEYVKYLKDVKSLFDKDK